MDTNTPSSMYPQDVPDRSYPLTMISCEGQQRRPSKDEQTFVDTIVEIVKGQIKSDAEFSPKLTGWLRPLAAEMLLLRAMYGEKGFWPIYERYTREYPILEPLRLLIEEQLQSNALYLPHTGGMMSEFQYEPIEWLWKDRLALGKLTTFDGDPGLGKSIIALDIAARITRGAAMPDGRPGLDGNVVIIAPEDGVGDTIQPRLQRAGADMARCYVIGDRKLVDQTSKYAYERPFTLIEDLQLLEHAIVKTGARLVVIDPIMAIMGTRDTYKDSEVRATMAPLLALLEKYHTACIIVRHLTKGGGDNALYRGGGSIAFIGLARTGLAAVRDPYDKTRCILAHIKSNIGRQAPALTYRIVSDEEKGDDRPYIEWGEASTLGTNELFSPSTDKPGESRQEILNILKERHPETVNFSELLTELDMTKANLGSTLSRMVKSGQINKTARGMYSAVSE